MFPEAVGTSQVFISVIASILLNECYVYSEDVNLPFPEIKGTELSGNTAMLPFLNPFRSSAADGVNYRIFEELPGLPVPSQKKVMAEELFSNWEVLFYFLETDRESVAYYLDLLEGKYKGYDIGEYQRHKVMILLSRYLIPRVGGLLVFLEEKMDAALQQLGVEIIRGQTSESIADIAAVSYSMVATLEPGQPNFESFSMIDEPSSLRKLLYLWSLAAFFMNVQDKKDALVRLRNVFSQWSLSGR